MLNRAGGMVQEVNCLGAGYTNLLVFGSGNFPEYPESLLGLDEVYPS